MLTTTKPTAAPTPASSSGIKRVALGLASAVAVVGLAVVAQLPALVVIGLVAVPVGVVTVATLMKRPELLLPLLFSTMWLEGLGVGQLTLGRGVAVVIMISPFALAATTGWRPPALRPRAWLPPFALLGWVWFSGFWVISIGLWFVGVFSYLVGFAFMLGCLLLVESYDHALKLFKLWLWAGVPVAILSDLTYFVVAPTVRQGEEVRVYGLSGSANNFAQYLVVAVAMSVAISRMSTGRERLYFRLMIPLYVSALVTSGSRAGLLGLGLMGIYVLVTWQGLSLGRRLLLVFGGTFSMLAVGIILIIINPRLNPLAAIATGASGRTDINTIGIAAAKDHWLFGLGAGNFLAVGSEYAFTTTGASLDNLRAVSTTLNPAIHNLYLGLIADTGVIGLVAYLSMFAMTMKNNWDLRRSEWKHLSWAITGSLLVFLFFAAQSPATNQKMQWALTGVVGSVYVRRRRIQRAALRAVEVDGDSAFDDRQEAVAS